VAGELSHWKVTGTFSRQSLALAWAPCCLPYSIPTFKCESPWSVAGIPLVLSLDAMSDDRLHEYPRPLTLTPYTQSQGRPAISGERKARARRANPFLVTDQPAEQSTNDMKGSFRLRRNQSCRALISSPCPPSSPRPTVLYVCMYVHIRPQLMFLPCLTVC